MKVIERSVQEIGKSFLITLPKRWATQIGIKKGTSLKLLLSEQGSLSIMPEHVAVLQEREITFAYDKHFNRRFFREYFEGYEKITIATNGITDAERKSLYAFLRRFMNAQIIEETEKQIVVKLFRIDELTMRECLDRMYHLSLNILVEPDRVKTNELRDTMTRFYYMLVMQIRRFLSEGKFANAKDVTLLRAMDFRMVAEKIQRIGETAASRPVSDQTVVRYYMKSYACFRDAAFEKALPLWYEGNELLKHCDGSAADIARYAKEISMLVR